MMAPAFDLTPFLVPCGLLAIAVILMVCHKE